MADLRADSRGVSFVVEKALAIGVAVLYIGVVTGVLLGGVVPEYRAATGDELGERVLATAATDIEGAVPAADGAVNHTSTIDLPDAIEDESYELHLRGRRLVLVHPDPAIAAETRLSLPPSVTVENGTWESTDSLDVRVQGSATNRTLRFDQ